MSDTIKVGMADYKLGKDADVLITLGLGSCVGIILYDLSAKKAGMAHIMLPSSKEIKNNSNIAKFADTAIEAMLSDLEKLGLSKNKLKAKIAGGSQMFKVAIKNENLNIGKRNVLAVKAKLEELKIPIIAEDVMGNHGRTIEFDCSTGELLIKTVGKGKMTI